MISDLVIAHPPCVGDIFNYTTDSGMSNSIVKITRTSTQTAKHTQGVWEITVRLVYLKLRAALASRLQECLGTEGLASLWVQISRTLHVRKKRASSAIVTTFFLHRKGSDVSMKKRDSACLQANPKREMWFTQMNTTCCSFTEVSGDHAGEYKGDYSSWPAGKPAAYTKWQSLFLAVEF